MQQPQPRPVDNAEAPNCLMATLFDWHQCHGAAGPSAPLAPGELCHAEMRLRIIHLEDHWPNCCGGHIHPSFGGRAA